GPRCRRRTVSQHDHRGPPDVASARPGTVRDRDSLAQVCRELQLPRVHRAEIRFFDGTEVRQDETAPSDGVAPASRYLAEPDTLVAEHAGVNAQFARPA